MDKLLIVINPKAGAGFEGNIKSLLETIADQHGFAPHFYFTKGENDAEEIKTQLKKNLFKTVIVAGGDGTINMVASLLINKKINLGIIPFGSANGLAFNLGIPTQTESAFRYALQSKPQAIDIIRINQKYTCLHLSDIGLNARIVRRFEKEGSRGMAGYGKQLFKELFSKKKAFHYQLQADGFSKKSKAEMIVIGNARSFGTGAVINPNGNIQDGKFEVVIIKPYPWWAIFYFIYHIFAGSLHKMNYVETRQTSRAAIKIREPQELQVDGEVIENIHTIESEILPGALNILYKPE